MSARNAQKKEVVVVIGLGYVGLPLAVLAAQKGYKVIGLEQNEQKVKLVNEGKNFLEDDYLKANFKAGDVLATTDPSILKKANIILVCVPTPVDEQYNPDLEPVKGAIRAICENMPKNPLIIIESTVNPGVCEEVVEPMFLEAGFKATKNYELAHCPERINPGDPKWNVTNIPRVVGAVGDYGLRRAVTFYENILEGSVMPMRTIREAEAAKIVENSFRDINIAFVNELAKSFDRMGIDIVNVIKGAATKPYAFMPHWPSCGVGGHCIPVDPYYLIERAKKSGFDHRFLRNARAINNSMPEYTVELLHEKLNDLKIAMNGTSVGVLGIAYKANVNDVRESPSLEIIRHLKKHKVHVLTYDPYIPKQSSEKSLEAILKKSKAIIIATNHNSFVEMDPNILKKYGVKIVIDGKNCLDKNAIEKLGILYKGIGR